MAELKPMEVIMKIDFAASNGLEIVAHAEKVSELVRCKDCKSCNTDIAIDGWYGMCTFWNGHSVMDDDYCSRFRNKDSIDMMGADNG